MDELLNDRPVVNVGSRQSNLALIQTSFVISELQKIYPNHDFKVTTMKTIGDKILEKPLPEIGDKGLFTQELEEALLDGRVDFIVHSLKDLPTSLPPGCVIGAILEREDPRDVLVLKESLSLATPLDLLAKKDILADGRHPVIGTSSLRRRAQLKRLNPSLEIVDIRGNITTRLDKLDGKKEGIGYDALILASAGLTRGGYAERVSHSLSSPNWLYAVGQGALAIEMRQDDKETQDFLLPLLDQPTIYECLAERSLLFHLEGGCSVPIGVTSTWTPDDVLTLQAAVFSLDGKDKIESTSSVQIRRKNLSRDEFVEKKSKVEDLIFAGFLVSTDCPVLRENYKAAYDLGHRLANNLKIQGADKLLSDIKILKEKRKSDLNTSSSSSSSSSTVDTSVVAE